MAVTMKWSLSLLERFVFVCLSLLSWMWNPAFAATMILYRKRMNAWAKADV